MDNSGHRQKMHKNVIPIYNDQNAQKAACWIGAPARPPCSEDLQGWAPKKKELFLNLKFSD